MASDYARMNEDFTLNVKDSWKAFNIVAGDSKGAPRVHSRALRSLDGREGDAFIVVISGCLTAVSPTKNQAGWDLNIASLPDPRLSPKQDIHFLAPMSMSRFEGVFQCGTSMKLSSAQSGRKESQLSIYFGKNSNPMVLHICALAYTVGPERGVPLDLSGLGKEGDLAGDGAKDIGEGDEDEEELTPVVQTCGHVAFLKGELEEATYGPRESRIGTLPKQLRPKRELRFLAMLLRQVDPDGDPQRKAVEQSVAVTLHPDGSIAVVGGRTVMADNKGNVKVLPTPKRGRLCFDGIRFSLIDGEKIQVANQLSGANTKRMDAVAVKRSDVVILEGYISWASHCRVNTKQPLALLPQGCWPKTREVFYTRGGSDTEERKRVDIDEFGRVFCPEGAGGFRLELTGIIFIAANKSPGKPAHPEWDDLKLNFYKNEVDVVTDKFEGREMLEEFIGRTNYKEWNMLQDGLSRNAMRKIHLPLQVALRGRHKWDPSNIGQEEERFWNEHKSKFEKYGLKSLQTLYHVSDDLFLHLMQATGMKKNDHQRLYNTRMRLRRRWDWQRWTGLSFAKLQDMANTIVMQLFEHFDIHAQIQAAMQNDFRPPDSITHLFPARRYEDRYIKGKIKPEDQEKFEQVRQFFLMYETTGNRMTHCSLMGAQDSFTTTGKWYFPDVPGVQQQLFENVQWLFHRNIHLYFSERQGPRFPFIEDLDIQCRPDWEHPLGPNERPQDRRPPDSLLMDFPKRIGPGKFDVDGRPGALLEIRAKAIHLLYPDIDKLRVHVYSASGYNKGKDMLKASFHLVWPQLTVDPDRAPVVREVTLAVFAKETKKGNTYLSTLHSRLLQLDESNNWELVFDATTIHARNGLRLPYSDKASQVIATEEEKIKVKQGLLSKNKATKRRVREDRPSKGIGVIEFQFEKTDDGQEDIVNAKWIADTESFPISEWCAMGTCRRDPANPPELTPWQLGPEVAEYLPKKAGVTLDGRDGTSLLTHKPFPNIRIFDKADKSPAFFRQMFDKALESEIEILKHGKFIEDKDLSERLLGSWIHVTAQQAVWRSIAAPKSLYSRHRDRGDRKNKGLRQAEVLYLANKGKVIVEGEDGLVQALLRILEYEGFTKQDDNPVMPLYDVDKMSAPPPKTK